MNLRLTQPVRALAAGVVCLSILSGMLVVHAWPLWTGTTVLLPVRPIDPRDPFRGEFVRLDTPATRLAVGPGVAADRNGVPVTPVGELAAVLTGGGSARRLIGRPIYVQLQLDPQTGEHVPAGVSLEPIADALNLRGTAGHLIDERVLAVSYGLDAYYMQEGTARPVEHALRDGRRVQMEAAIADSGRARIRRLRIDGAPR